MLIYPLIIPSRIRRPCVCQIPGAPFAVHKILRDKVHVQNQGQLAKLTNRRSSRHKQVTLNSTGKQYNPGKQYNKKTAGLLTVSCLLQSSVANVTASSLARSSYSTISDGDGRDKKYGVFLVPTLNKCILNGRRRAILPRAPVQGVKVRKMTLFVAFTFQVVTNFLLI